MNMIDIFSRLDLSKAEMVDTYDLQEWLPDINFPYDIQYLDEELIELHQLWIYSWIDTDTRVGMKVLLFKDNPQPVAVMTQNGRKSYNVVDYVSEQNFQRLVKYYTDLIVRHSKAAPIFDIYQDASGVEWENLLENK